MATEASMDASAKSAHYLLTANEREYLAKLCWLLHDAGTHALRVTFDTIHPPLVLKEHLSQTHVKTMLTKLHQQKALTDKHWKTLYPIKKRGVTSQRYDSRLLAILLQTVCHLCPPYPHGWNALPLGTDSSLSADVVRLSILFQQIGSLGGVRDEEYPVLWKQIGEVLLRLGGPPARIKIQRIDNESVPPDLQNHYIQLIKDIWTLDEKGMFSANLEALSRHSQTSSKSPKKKGSRVKKKEDEGIPPEDKHVIMKVYKTLVDSIIAEDIMDRLQQGQIIKISDRQEIMALSKNQERMQLILDKILASRVNYAFKLLCDALKFKYPKEYEMVMKTRKATYKQGIVETVDLVSVCQEALSAMYKLAFSRCTPLPWMESLHMSVRDFYTPVDIVDSDGKKQHLSDIFPTQNKSGKGKRIVLEGAPGIGQTTLATMLTHMWANQKNYFKVKYEFLVHIDAHAIGEDFQDSVYKQVLPENTKLSVQEFWSLLEANARDVVFLIDGFDEDVPSPDLKQIIQGSKMKLSSVVLFVHPEIHVHRYVTADAKLFNIGLNSGNVSRCLKTYGYLMEMTAEQCDELLEMAQNKEWTFRHLLSSPFICLATIMVYKICKERDIVSISTTTELFELFGEAMAKDFCGRQNIDVVGTEFPDEVLKTIGQLQQLAFAAVCGKRRIFTDGQLIHESQNILMTKFGVLVKNGLNNCWKMTCSLLADFLTARYLADMPMGDLSEIIAEQKLLSRVSYANMISFLCGLFRNDHDTPTLGNIFTELKTHNIKQTRALNRTGHGKPVDGETSTTSHLTSGYVTDYYHSLQGLSESECRDDVLTQVVESMPSHLIIRRDGTIPHTCVHGLSAVLINESVNITHIEINLLPVYMLQPDIYLTLAETIGNSPHVRRLRVLWYGLELMAKFLSIATRNAQSLQSLQIEDCSKKVCTQVTAETWADLQQFCSKLENIKKFIFLNCKMASVVCHVLHHLPETLEEIDFAGCAMNPICAGEVATKIEHSKKLKRLNLSSTRLESSDIKALTKGVKLGESLEELNLGGTRLDRSGVVALAESIRMSNTLQCLDLSNSELTTELCRILAGGIADSRTLTKLVVSYARMTSEGRLFISQAKESALQIVGLKTLKYISPV
ncbi:NACHT, LRR and PYD domains-containing protein 13-like [Haliotis cracherodii]|uniref:NACHT, LRR and PYD domains-containing protein 13-like n=1 Tax=Haliotis cracherodii TaxID=6455 RepID=UPI0039EA093A